MKLQALKILLLTWLSATSGLAAPAKEGPSILLIIADDLGWNDVGYHGSEIRTPNLDRLAREGVQLDHFYVHPTCSPTRAALLTGRHPGHFGITSPLGLTDTRVIPKGTPTLATGLGVAGYSTALVGKWHLGPRAADGPRQYGFERSYGMLHGAVDKYTHRDGAGTLTWHRDDQPLEEKGHADDLIANEAIRLLEASRSDPRPFFLQLAFGHGHLPLQEELARIDSYRDTIPIASRRLYAASVTHMDENVGRVLAALRASGRERDTLVIFFSDNGGIAGPLAWRGGETGAWYGDKFPNRYEKLGDNHPLRGGKGEVYEGGIRVPAIVRWPDGLDGGRKVSQPVQVNDVLPTLAALAGAPPPAGVDGIDFWPSLRRDAPLLSRTLIWETPKAFALRQGDWKLIHHGAALESGKAELYDLAADPLETNDLARVETVRTTALKLELVRRLPIVARGRAK